MCNIPQLIDIDLIMLVVWIGFTMLCVFFIVSGFKISTLFLLNRTCLYMFVIRSQLIDIDLIMLVVWIGFTMLCVFFIVSGFKISTLFLLNRTCLYMFVIRSEERTHTYRHVFEREKICTYIHIELKWNFSQWVAINDVWLLEYKLCCASENAKLWCHNDLIYAPLATM